MRLADGNERGIRRLISNLGLSVLVRISPRRVLEGMPVGLLQQGTASEDDLFRKIGAALACIRGHDAAEYRRVSRYLASVVSVDLKGSYGWYWHNLRACFLDPSYVLASSPEAIAMTIVHEAAHARIRQLGIATDHTIRPRVEALCVRAEIRFARRVPGMNGLIAEAQRRRDAELSKVECS